MKKQTLKTRKRFRKFIRTCPSGKIGHSNYAEAQRAAELQMLGDHVDPGCHVTPYLCSECHEWHNGNRRIVFVDPPHRAPQPTTSLTASLMEYAK